MIFSLLACVQNIQSPNLGDCAEYPTGSYDYGQVAIGTCLAGPSDMQFIDHDGDSKLLISNANPYLNFTTGSLLVLDWNAIDLSIPKQYVHEVAEDSIAINLSMRAMRLGEFISQAIQGELYKNLNQRQFLRFEN